MSDWNIGAVRVDYFPSTLCTVTTFPDGSTLCAAPHDTDEYRATAKRLGYGDDTAALSREHELAHSFLAWRRGLPYSPTLYAVATGTEEAIPLQERHDEEAMVMAFQQLVNGVGPVDPVLFTVFTWGYLNEMREAFLILSRGRTH